MPAVLLVAGLFLWWKLGTPLNRKDLLALMFALFCALVPIARRWVRQGFEKICHPTAGQRAKAAWIIGLLATLYLIFTGIWQGRDFVPKFHDEYMILLQMRMIAQGRLWMPQHPMADFFESFHIVVKPVYAGIYFPGAALMYVPSIWLGLPFWVLPAMASGAVIGLVYWLMSEWIDGLAGALAALMLLSLSTFRYLSLIVMQHTVMLLLGVGLLVVYLQWRKRRSWPWMAAMGVMIGWAAITRPLDALCFAVPVGLAVAMDLRGQHWRKWAATGLMIIACAAPFLQVQLVMNKGITGQYLKMPYRLYAEQYSPDWGLGFAPFDPNVRPKSTLLQKQIFYDQFDVPAATKHRPENIWPTWLHERLPLIVKVCIPSSVMLVVVPVGLFELRRRRWILLLIPACFIAGYVFFPYFMAHYCMVLAPALIMAVLLGKLVVEKWVKRAEVSVFLTVGIAALCVTRMPEVDSSIKDDAFNLPMMVYSQKYLPTLVKRPALVLFTYHPGESIYAEPVYNESAAWPDDAEIIRAHDFGPERDRELIDYYARLQPNRHVYVLDRGNLNLQYLGTPAEVAKRLSATTKP
jgi:hypothetical protein